MQPSPGKLVYISYWLNVEHFKNACGSWNIRVGTKSAYSLRNTGTLVAIYFDEFRRHLKKNWKDLKFENWSVSPENGESRTHLGKLQGSLGIFQQELLFAYNLGNVSTSILNVQNMYVLSIKNLKICKWLKNWPNNTILSFLPVRFNLLLLHVYIQYLFTSTYLPHMLILPGYMYMYMIHR